MQYYTGETLDKVLELREKACGEHSMTGQTTADALTLSNYSRSRTSGDGGLVVASDLTVAYNDGAVVAVDKLNLTVPGGQVIGILGGNGAGKTSTLRTFGGIIPPTSGILTIGGHSMSSAKEVEKARRDLGYCPDTGGLIRQATIREHLGVALTLWHMQNLWPEALDLVEKFGLSHVIDRETGGFSHGMSRRLSVLLAVLTSRSVLILDEPFDGVDPMGVNATEDAIRAAASAGLAVVVSTHLLSLLVRVSDRICVMDKGRIIADEPAETFTGERGEKLYEHLLWGTETEKRTVQQENADTAIFDGLWRNREGR